MKANIDLGNPSEELQQWAKENINENPETKQQQLDELRELILQRRECNLHRDDDLFLLRFLRARHFIPRPAHRLVVNFYKFRENNPDLFLDIDVCRLIPLWLDDAIDLPPYLEQTGRRIIFCRFGNWDPETVDISDLFKMILLLAACAVVEQAVQIKGVVCVIDLKNMTSKQARHLTPSVAQKIVQILVTSFPIRIHAIHIVNNGWLFNAIYMIFKPFLNEIMRSKIHFHGDSFENLHKDISPDYLPELYGGIQKKCDFKDWITIIQTNEVVQQELTSIGFDLAKIDQEIYDKI